MPGLAGPAACCPTEGSSRQETGCLLSLGWENAAAAFRAAAVGESCPKPSRERWEGCRSGVWVCWVRGFPGRWDSPPGCLLPARNAPSPSLCAHVCLVSLQCVSGGNRAIFSGVLMCNSGRYCVLLVVPGLGSQVPFPLSYFSFRGKAFYQSPFTFLPLYCGLLFPFLIFLPTADCSRQFLCFWLSYLCCFPLERGWQLLS